MIPHLRGRVVGPLLIVPAVAVLLILHGTGTSPTHSRPRPAGPTTCPATRWIESWYAAPSDAESSSDARFVPFNHGPQQTLRMVISPHYGGSLVRIRLSNTFGTAPITINQVAIAQDQANPDQTSAAIVPGSSVPVLFGGQAFVTIPAGGEVVSDPVHFTFSAFENLAVSMYLAGSYVPTEHFTGRQISFGTAPDAGDDVTDTSATAFTQTTTARYLLTGLDVQAAGNAGTVVAFGDSLTDGYQPASSRAEFPEDSATLNLNARWPDFLAQRLQAAQLPLSVANSGISGNQILKAGSMAQFGPPALYRFERDAIDVPGVSTIILLEGGNDISVGTGAAQIEAGLTELVNTAHAAGIRILLGTLTPTGAATSPALSDAAATTTREDVNAWIRSQHIANGYIDFAAAVQDPSDPNILAPADNGGDGVHLTPAGYQALADAVDLSQITGPSCVLTGLTVTADTTHITAGVRASLRFRVTVTASGHTRPVAGAVIIVDGRRLRTDSAGTATLSLRPSRTGHLPVKVTLSGYAPATATIRVTAARR